MTHQEPTPPTFGLTGRLAPPGAPHSAPEASAAPSDPDLAPVAASSPLDALRAELGEEVTTADVVLEVPGRPGYAVRYGTTIDYEELSAWRKRAKDKSSPSGVDELRLAAIILANRCTGIIRQGTEVLVDGEPLTFARRELQELVDAGSAREAVIRLYGRDPHVMATAGEVLREAGYDDDVASAGEDPTTDSRRA